MKNNAIIISLVMGGYLFTNIPMGWSAEKATKPASVKTKEMKKEAKVEGRKVIYNPPKDIGRPEGTRGGGSRGSQGLPGVFTTLAPINHMGLTSQAQPFFYWYISQTTKYPIEFTLIEDQAIDPLLEKPLPTPTQPGVQVIQLPDYGVRLEAGKTYQWFVTIVHDKDRRSKDLLTSGWIRMAELPTPVAEQITQADPRDATALYAQAGFWYDALEAISVGISSEGQNDGLRQVRTSLLQQIGLDSIGELDQK